MSQHTPKVPMHEDEINMHKPVCAEFASFRAGIRCAERVYQVNDLVRQVNYWTDEWSDVSDQNQSLRNQIGKITAEAEAAVKQAREDALDEALRMVWKNETAAGAARAVESLKGKT